MIIVSSIALATMLSNNLLIPYGFVGSLQNKSQEKNNKRIIRSRKIGIFLLIILAYAIYRIFILDYSLVCGDCTISSGFFWRSFLETRI
jgi:hypothetical protein